VPDNDELDAEQPVDSAADEADGADGASDPAEEMSSDEMDELLAAETEPAETEPAETDAVETGAPPAGALAEPVPRRVNWRGLVASFIGMAFAVNIVASYEGGWKVLPSQVIADEPRVGISKRSDGRYLVVSGDLFDVKEAIDGGHYGMLRDKRVEPGYSMGPVIAAYFGPGAEVPAEGTVTLDGRIVELPAEVALLYRRFEGGGKAPCLRVGAPRWRSWYFWGAVIIAVWGAAILVRSVFVGEPKRVVLDGVN